MSIHELKQEENDPVVFADQRGLVTHVNRSFQTVFGWSDEEIVGKPLTVIIPGNLQDAHQLGFSRFLTTGKPTLLNRPLRLKAVTKGGREFDAEHFITAERADGQWVFAARIRPKAGAE